jgi:hypothetical protein
MSVTVMSRVFWTDLSELNATHRNGKGYSVSASTAKLILLAMADSADDFGENSFNSIDTLAQKTSLKRRSVPRVIRAMEANGYCKYRGLSVYGTSNYSINLKKLGYAPERRSKVGRPKTSDSGSKTSDSGSKTSDSESPESSLTHPVTNKQLDTAEMISKRTATLTKLYWDNIGAPAPLMADLLRNAAIDYKNEEWYQPAFEAAVKSNARHWNFVEAVLKGWTEHEFGWRPERKSQGRGATQKPTERAPIVPVVDDGREMTRPDVLRKPKILVDA